MSCPEEAFRYQKIRNEYHDCGDRYNGVNNCDLK